MSVTLYQIQRKGRLVALVSEFSLVVPKYFWVVSMELPVTFLDTQNFEVAPGLFENLRNPGLRHWTKKNRKFCILLYKSCLTFPVLSHILPSTNRAVCKVINNKRIFPCAVFHISFHISLICHNSVTTQN